MHLFNGIQTPSAVADAVFECTTYATQAAGSMTMKVRSMCLADAKVFDSPDLTRQ